MKNLILMFVFICALSVGVFAQTPTPTPTDAELDLQERAQMVAEIKMLRTENSGLKTQVSELKNQVEVYKRLDGVQEARIADLKEALAFRTEANNIDIKIENLYKSQIEDYKVENARLRDENAKLRKSRDRRSLIFGAVGLLAGKLIW